MMNAVIVDDESDSREILRNYLSRYCADVNVSAVCNSVTTAYDEIIKYDPDIVFLDIEMPFGNGFDLLDKFEKITFETVFVTAFNHYAIQALNQSAAYYLLKPINIDELVKAVDKIRRERADARYVQHTKVLMENRKSAVQKIMLPTMEGFEIVDVSKIMYCESNDNFSVFHLVSGAPLTICRTLKHFEEILAPYKFVRIHRSFLINPEFVVRYSKGKGGFVTMQNNRELEVSSSKKKDFLDLFGQ